MKFTLNWLKDHLDTTASLHDIATALTACGLEVESITDRSKDLSPFTVAKILHAEKHPEADKLRVCKVQSNVGELQIVCGAPNARAGLTVALAKEGAVIPGNGMVIKKSKIRGVESQGMLCSLEELAVAGDSEGIVELPDNAMVGEPVASVLGLDDAVIDIAITPNRADCLSVRGVARDLAALGIGTLKSAPHYAADNACLEFWKSSDFEAFHSKIPVKIGVGNSECNAFSSYSLKNIKNVHAPIWIKQRLEAIGQKSISAVVDITNYLMFDLGRPMHAYDEDKISGTVYVRSAFEGEKFLALNDIEYTLLPSMVVIADDAGVIGLAGIIGGKRTACDAETKNVFLEVASFNSASIARTARALNILTEARYRFERKVDPKTRIRIDSVDQPIDRDVPAVAAYMIYATCGGKVSYLNEPLCEGGWLPGTIPLRAARVAELGGTQVEETQMEATLVSLGFTLEKVVGGWNVTPPSWRADVEGEADLVEEILRINGYDNIPAVSLPKLPTLAKPAYSPMQRRAHIAKRLLASRGMMELCTWSFLPQAQAVAFGGGSEALKLLNPISAELDAMRPSLLPNLLEAAKRNANRGFSNTQLFEVGLQFHDTTPTGQKLVAAGIHAGTVTSQPYYENSASNNHNYKAGANRYVDAFDAKADALALLAAMGMHKAEVVSTHLPSYYHPGRSGALTLGGKVVLGYFGDLHPGLLAELDVEGRVAAFELFLEAIPTPRAKGKARSALKVSDFQAVERDFAFIVAESISAADVVKAINAAEKQLITAIEIFDVYSGTGVEAGKKSVAVKVTLQAADRTLSEADINAVSAAIVAAASKAFGGQLRQ